MADVKQAALGAALGNYLKGAHGYFAGSSPGSHLGRFGSAPAKTPQEAAERIGRARGLNGPTSGPDHKQAAHEEASKIYEAVQGLLSESPFHSTIDGSHDIANKAANAAFQARGYSPADHSGYGHEDYKAG